MIQRNLAYRVLWIVLISILVLVSACTPEVETQPAAQATEPEISEEEPTTVPATEAPPPTAIPEPTKVTVAMHWTAPTHTWTGFLWAAENGFYEEENLEVEFLYLKGSSLSVQTVGAGDAQIGVAGAENVLIGLSQGVPFTVVANHLQNSPLGVITTASTGIDSIAALAGHSVSTAQASPESATLEGLLREVGLDPESDVELIYVDPQSKCTIVLTGDADSCTGFYTSQLITLENETDEAVFIPFSTDERPFPGHMIFVNNEFLAENGDVVVSFLRATIRGYVEADKDLEATIALFQKLLPESDPEFNAEAIKRVHELMRSERTDNNGWGWMTDATFKAMHDMLLAGAVIDSEVDISSAYTNEYLPEERNTWNQ